MLTRSWHSSGVFVELPRSAADVARHHATREGDIEHRLFWAQFQAPEHPPLLSNQMKHLMQLDQMPEPAMKDHCVRLWPTEPISSIYFSLVQKLHDAASQVEAVKRSTYIEGARMAFTKTMVHWPKIKLVKMATRPPPAGKEHRCHEQYFPIIMDGARVIEDH